MSTDQKEITVADKTREFFKTKLDAGYPIPNDKPEASIFVKEAMTTLGLKSGNRTKTKEILQEVLKDRNIDTSKLGFAKSVSEKFHFIKDEVSEPPQQNNKNNENNIQQQKQSEPPKQETTLPKSEPIEKPKEPLPEIFKQRYHRDIGSMTKWFHNLSVKHGIRQPEPEGKKPEVIELGEDWADYLYESGIRLPRMLGFMFLSLRTIVIVFIPLLKFFVKSKPKKTEQKETKK